MATVEEPKFDVWTGDILLGIGADKDTVSLLHVGAMVRMIYDKGRAEGKAEGEERLQQYTEAYLAEGIKRCFAALAQGRTEGAEQERERIRKESQFVTGSKNSDDDVYYCPNEDVYIIDASVLAPKEVSK